MEDIKGVGMMAMDVCCKQVKVIGNKTQTRECKWIGI